LAGGVGTATAATCPAEFNLPPDTVCDLTGEVCRGSSAEINGVTYCVMLGRLNPGEALEMDDINGDVPMAGDDQSVADANVFEALPGCALPCNDPDLPAIFGATYIDWNDLAFDAITRPGGIVDTTSLDLFGNGKPIGSVENNRITDFTANSDYTIFSGGASCVTDGSALPKEDFTQSYIANNDDYLYFAQERRTNSGNSVYYWMLTEVGPVLDAASPNCGQNTRGELVFTLTPGDHQVVLNFPSSSNPAAGQIFLRVYNGPLVTGVPADDAVFAPGWAEVPSAIENFALTVGPSKGEEADDAQPDWGGYTQQGQATPQDGTLFYETADMAEWAINLNVLFSTGSACGRSAFLTGISRSATGQVGDPTEPADLKDLVGPKLFSFGELEATATLTPRCDPADGFDYLFDFAASAIDVTGQPVPLNDLSCIWTCSSTTCGTPALSFDDPSQCVGTGTIARAQGAADAQPCDVSCTVDVTQVTTQCTDDDAAADDALAPILVSISPTPDMLTCSVPGAPGSDPGSTIGNGITYAASASGGNQPYSLAWSVSGPNETPCGGGANCTIDIPDADHCALTSVFVTVDDTSICPPADSEPEMVTKTSSVMASDNP
jgi:hypothetical protein